MQANKSFALWNTLLPQGLTALRQQRFRQAVELLGPIASADVRKALRWPQYRQALAACALAHYQCGEIEAALLCQTRLLSHFNVDQEGRDNFFHLLQAAQERLPDSPEFRALLLRLLPKTDVAAYAVPAARALLKDEAFARAFGLVLSADAADTMAALQRGRLHPILQSPLLLLLMRETLIPLPEFDGLFRKLRKALLLTHAASTGALPGKAEREFMGTLALHLWLAEYTVFEDEEESGHLDTLRARVADLAPAQAASSEAMQSDLACLALYQSWLTLPHCEDWLALPADAWKSYLRPLVGEWRACLEEKRLAAAMESLTPIAGEVTEKVRDQYEENPFPRWRHDPVARRRTSAGEWLRSLSPGIELPDAFHQPVDVLVAGCGTGLEPISLVRQVETAQVLAVDLSRASLAYARRMAGQLGLEDAIQFRQADIMALAGHEKRFHLITASGVLHHLQDPLAGWRILSNLLKPGGIMLVSLYSEAARQAVVRARQVIAQNGWTPTPASMRRLRQEILEDRLEDLKPLSVWRDFYNLSMLRDLVFHVNEHRFSIPRIEGHLAELGLKFLGMRGLPPATLAQFREDFPNDPEGLELAHWHRFEERHPATFASMYGLILQKPMGHGAA